MGQIARMLPGAVWEVDDAAPTWVRSDPPPSDVELTRVWKEDSSGVRTSELPDFSDPEREPALEATLVFPLERRFPPRRAFEEARAQTPMPMPMPPIVLSAPERPTHSFAIAVATFMIMSVLMAFMIPWLMNRF